MALSSSERVFAGSASNSLRRDASTSSSSETAAVFGAAFLTGAFLAGAFLAGAFLVVVFLVVAFLRAAMESGDSTRNVTSCAPMTRLAALVLLFASGTAHAEMLDASLRTFGGLELDDRVLVGPA